MQTVAVACIACTVAAASMVSVALLASRTRRPRARRPSVVSGGPTVVVGAGIAGLFVADSLARRGRGPVVLLEREAHVGGRIRTVYDPSGAVQYEAGPWRLHRRHTRMLRLVRELGLSLRPLSSATPGAIHSNAVPEPQHLPTDGCAACVDTPAALSVWDQDTLCHGGPRDADLAGYRTGYGVQLRHEARGSNSYRAAYGREAADTGDVEYFVVAEGLSAVVRELEARARAAGVQVMLQTAVEDISIPEAAGGYRLRLRTRTGGNAFQDDDMHAGRLCLALPPRFTSTWAIAPLIRPVVEQVATLPLMHVYARVSLDDLRPELAAAPGFKVISAQLGEQLISADFPAGYAQVAYAGGSNARALQRLRLCSPERFRLAVLDSAASALNVDPATLAPCVGQLHPEYWEHAVHFWRPGYGQDIPHASWRATAAPHPTRLPNLVWAGEAFSTHQGWTEGALSTAELALSELCSPTPLLQRLPDRSPPAEHVVFQGIAVDVSAWKAVHPGSEAAIRNHMGEDVTQLFGQIEHPNYAFGILGALQTCAWDTNRARWLGLTPSAPTPQRPSETSSSVPGRP